MEPKYRKRSLGLGILVPLLVFIIPILIYLANLFTLRMPVTSALEDDYRNDNVQLSIRYSYYVNPNAISISLDECTNAAPVDILRALLQTAEVLENRSYSKVELHKGFDHRFTMKGDYFQKLGAEYDIQNPVYTLRTLPEHVYQPDGTQAYYNFQSGFSGLSEQMETFQEFTEDWCRE